MAELRINNMIGKLDVPLDYGAVTVAILWDGLANIIRKQKLPILDFLEANPMYRKNFPDESKKSAALTQVKLLDEPEKSSPSLAFLRLPKDWRLRGVPKSFIDP